MKKFRIVFAIILIYFIISCNPKTKLRIPNELLSKEEVLSRINGNKDYCIVYFFRGGCSFCYAMIMYIEQSFPDLGRIYIYSSKDTMMTNHNLKKLNLKNVIPIYDKDYLFLKANVDLLPDHLFLVDSSLTVLKSGKQLDKKLKRKILKRIKQH
jgi:hypothetical protein